MNLTKFRIFNYKSIVDSGYCDIASDITIIVGKNESGKTAILEALRDFNRDILEIPQNAFPLDGSEEMPQIEMCFQVDQGDVATIQSELGVPLPEESVQYMLDKGLNIIKDGRGQYHVEDPSFSRIFKGESNDKNKDQKIHIKSMKEKLSSLMAGQSLPDLNVDSSPDEIQKNARELMVIIKSFLPSFSDENKKKEIIESIRSLIQETSKLAEPGIDLKEKFIHCVIKLAPRFIYMSEFIGHFPFEIPIGHIKQSEPMLDFARISGLDLDKIISTQDIQKRINILNRHSAVINGEFGDYWQQNKVELVVKPEGDKILFGVKERDKTDFFKIEQRSKGFQWFLSFYLRLSAQESKNNIILIDEPGTNLHAKAQNEILKVLEERIAAQTPVILSTHSPYFIDPHRLDRIRLVTKDPSKGSVISNRIKRSIDADTLMPINTALQLETFTSFPLSEKHNIIINDLADFYFLNAVRKFLNTSDQKEINLLPAGGDERSLEQLVSLMKGFDYDFQVVFSHRADGQEKAKRLQKIFGLENEKIVHIPLDPGFAVEDLLADEDFYTYVVQRGAETDTPVTNSQYFEVNHIDCVLAAKRFYEKTKTQNISLSNETITTFQKIFDRIILGEPTAEPPAEAPPPPEETIQEVIEKPIEEVKEEAKEEVKEEVKEEIKEEPKPQNPEPAKKNRWFFADK